MGGDQEMSERWVHTGIEPHPPAHAATVAVNETVCIDRWAVGIIQTVIRLEPATGSWILTPPKTPRVKAHLNDQAPL